MFADRFEAVIAVSCKLLFAFPFYFLLFIAKLPGNLELRLLNLAKASSITTLPFIPVIHRSLVSSVYSQTEDETSNYIIAGNGR